VGVKMGCVDFKKHVLFLTKCYYNAYHDDNVHKMEMMETGNLFLDFDFGMEGRWNQNMVGSVAPKFSS